MSSRGASCVAQTPASEAPTFSSDVRFVLPLRLVNVANAREHWAVRKRRAEEQVSLTVLFVFAHGVARMHAPHGLEVTLTRIAPRPMDSDGAIISAKHVRDGVARAVGVDDGSGFWTWLYGQRKPRRGEVGLAAGGYGVEVEVRATTEGEAFEWRVDGGAILRKTRAR